LCGAYKILFRRFASKNRQEGKYKNQHRKKGNNMNLQIKRTVILFSSLLFIASVQGTVFAAKKATKKTCADLGAIDLNSYCQKKMGGKAELKGKSWRCVPPKDAKGATSGVNTKYNADISMNDACIQQYGTKAKAQASNPKDPNSWRCVDCSVAPK
jgi:hypothetical protein